MASYSVGADKHGAYNKTLTATTVDTVTFIDDLRSVEVVGSGSADIFFTVDGSTPTVNGDNCWIIPAGGVGVREVSSPMSGGTVVKLISSGTPTYSVTGLN